MKALFGGALIIGGAYVLYLLVSIRRAERDRLGPESPCDCNVCRGAE